MLRIEGKEVRLLGPHPARLFASGCAPAEYAPEASLSFLLKGSA